MRNTFWKYSDPCDHTVANMLGCSRRWDSAAVGEVRRLACMTSSAPEPGTTSAESSSVADATNAENPKDIQRVEMIPGFFFCFPRLSFFSLSHLLFSLCVGQC